MSQIDAEANVLSEDKDRIDDISVDNVKLVPVAESIRYRKRAQAAEQKVEQLSEQLSTVRSEAEALAEKMSQLETEQVLTRKLVAAGASDLETALLVARARAAKEGADVDGLVEQLRNEKPHLFDPAKVGNKVPRGTRTAAVKDRLASGKTSLRLRRNFV
jgi:predicted  nucleic acid-binding Zn-ribbon protein